MTRSDYEQSVANKLGIINALKDNVGDEFTALEISAAMIDPPDLKPLQIGAVLKSMVADGLVSKRPSKNMNVYRLTKKALAWTPPPYDWRAEGAMVTAPESAAEPVTAKPPAAGKVNGTPVQIPLEKQPARKPPKPSTTKPTDTHPWVSLPAVQPEPEDKGAITRPLPAHLETPLHSPASPDPGALDLDEGDLATMALPEAPIAPAFGTGAFLLANPPFEASSQPAVDNSNSPEIPDSSPLPTDSREDEPLAQPEITPAAISRCGGNGECGGHCANHAKDSDEGYLAESLERALAEIANLTDNMECLESYKESLANQLSEAQSKLADALADLATSRRERDLLHQRLREQERQRAEDQNRIDALMDVARPHLAKNISSEQQGAIMAEALMELLRLALLRIPHPDHYAGVGKMVGSEARP